MLKCDRLYPVLLGCNVGCTGFSCCLLRLIVDLGVLPGEGVACCACEHEEAFKYRTRLTFCLLRKLLWEVSELHPACSCSRPVCVECSNQPSTCDLVFEVKLIFQDSESLKSIEKHYYLFLI